MKQLGTSHAPIEIEDDLTNQQADQIKRKQHEANRQALEKAHLGSEFDVALAVIKTELHGSDQEKDRTIKNRINKFFSAQVKSINPETQHFRTRREPDYNLPEIHLVPSQLILYGIDFISNKQIRKMFKGIQTQLKCLDDSHCKILFKSVSDCQAGLRMNLKDENSYNIKLENQEMQVPQGWFELKPYHYLTFQRKLWCRYAMSNQNDAEIERSNDHYMIMQAKKQFEASIKSEITEIRYLSIMMKFNFIDQKGFKEKIARNRHFFRENGEERRFRESRHQRRYDSTEKRSYQRDQERRKNRESSLDNMSERSRNKPEKNKKNVDLDNLSILSEAPSQRRKNQRKELDLSFSVKSNKNKQEQREEDSNLSFLLNKSEIQQGALLKNLINLNLDSSMSLINPKEEQNQDRLSIMSEPVDPKDSKLKYEVQTPGVLNQNKIEPKKRKKANANNIQLISLLDN